MPLVDIQVIAGVFDDAQKRTMIERVTDAMVSVEGEVMRGVTWVNSVNSKLKPPGIGSIETRRLSPGELVSTCGIGLANGRIGLDSAKTSL